MSRSRSLLVILLFLLSAAPPARGQYMYLDSNGDGVHSGADSLAGTKSTAVTIYLDTDHDRDGSIQVCNSHTSAPKTGTALSLFSYTLVLRVAEGTGTVSWGAYADSAGFGALGSDQSNSVTFTTSRTRDTGSLRPGKYKLGQIPVTVTSGAPALQIGTVSSLDPAFFTGFGTQCEGSASANTYVLGTDWFDVDGVSAPSGGGTGYPSSILASGPGRIFLGGNPLDSPYILSKVGGRLAVNGFSLPPPPSPYASLPALTPEQQLIASFAKSITSLRDSLVRTGSDERAATLLLREFCNASRLVTDVNRSGGDLRVRFTNGFIFSLPVASEVVAQPKAGARASRRDHDISELRDLQEYVETGCIVFILDANVQHVVSRVNSKRALTAIARLRDASGSGDTREYKFPQRLQAQLLQPAHLERVQ